MITYKTCSLCKCILPEDRKHFSPNKKGKRGLKSVCKICQNIKTTIRRRYHREQIINRYPNESDYKRYLRMIYTYYKIREDDLRNLMDKQSGCCAICGESLVKPIWSKSHLHIDHCHTTYKVRGLLCGKCNWLLGVAQENSSILKKAIAYLEDLVNVPVV